MRVRRGTLERLASHLGLGVEAMAERYLEKTGYGWSIRMVQHQDGPACVFWEEGCTVYPVRPPQCRSFPFWEGVSEEELRLCPGVCSLDPDHGGGAA